MKRQSRTDLAKRFVDLLERHPKEDAIQALAKFIINERRSGELNLIVREIGRELESRNGFLEVTVETARDTSNSVLQSVQDFFKQATGARSVLVTPRINPSLIGGMVATTTDYELDASLRNKLQRLEI